jgi:hypothetical protein
MHRKIIVLACCLLSGIADEYAAAGFSETIRHFGTKRYALEKDLSSKLNLHLPAQVDKFFSAAIEGDYLSISNNFQPFMVCAGDGYSRKIPQIENELWTPIHETIGVWDAWVDWGRNNRIIEKFCTSILASIPKDSIYFGGTDYGRFFITAVNDSQASPKIFCVTQNALADRSYMAYLRAVYGDKIWIPSQNDVADSFKKYIAEVKNGSRKKNPQISHVNGKVKVTGVLGVMEINGIIAGMMFDHNKDKHEFYIEESYVIDWMYPYLEPHGLILKLNHERIGKLSQQSIDDDFRFWDSTGKQLLAMPEFRENKNARKGYAKLRSAIAGVYEYHQKYAEAEKAYRQAIRICPGTPEPNYRLAYMYRDQAKQSAAVATLKEYLKYCDPDDRARAESYIRRLEE